MNNEVFSSSECGTKEQPNRQPKVPKQLKAQCNELPIRVGVMFTQMAENTGLNMTNIAQTAISDLNNIMSNSDVAYYEASFQLAGVQKLNGFMESNNGCNDISIYSGMNDTQQFRDNDAMADVIVLLTAGEDYGSILGCSAGIGVSDVDAFSIVQVVEANSRFSFPHEVIHLIGGNHQQCDLYDNCCENWNICGAPQYCDPFCSDNTNFNNGWKYTTGRWIFKKKKTTLMHQLQDGWTRQPELSNPDIHGRVNLNDNARMVRENACTVAGFNPNPVSVNITGPTLLFANSSGTWCADVQHCNNVQNITWEVSTNGWNYNFAGSGNCISWGMGNTELYIRISVHCANGQTANNFFIVWNSTSPGFKSKESSTRNITQKTHTETISDAPFSVYPNPSHQVFNLSYHSHKGARNHISLLDMKGNVILQRSVKSFDNDLQSLTVDVQDIKAGLYILRISNSHQTKTQKVIIHEAN